MYAGLQVGSEGFVVGLGCFVCSVVVVQCAYSTTTLPYSKSTLRRNAWRLTLDSDRPRSKQTTSTGIRIGRWRGRAGHLQAMPRCLRVYFSRTVPPPPGLPGDPAPTSIAAFLGIGLASVCCIPRTAVLFGLAASYGCKLGLSVSFSSVLKWCLSQQMPAQTRPDVKRSR